MLEELKKLPPEEIEKIKKEIVLKPLHSAEELQAWMYLFMDISFPLGTVYPTSTHGPADAMYRIYELMFTRDSQFVPQIAMLASRDSYKTLGAAAIEVLCMIHFRISVAHGAAIKPQSEKAIQYVNAFFRKLRPYLEHHGWKKTSDSKVKIEWLTEKEEAIYLRVVVATVAGMNCFDLETIIIKEDGSKALAKNIRVGDKIKSVDLYTQKTVYRTVETVGLVSGDTREYVFEDGSNLIIGNTHKVFTKKGWVSADTLKIGDLLFKENTFSKDYTTPKLSNTKVNWNLNSMIFGTLLGDASLQQLPSGSIRYQLYHCSDQLEYLKEINRVFLDNGIKSTIIKDRSGYRLYTETHDFFKQAHRICYRDGKRTVNQQWLANVDLEALAFLIMDDGTMCRKTINGRKESPMDIAVMGYSEFEQQLIVNRINKLGYKSKVWKKDRYNQIRVELDSYRNMSEDFGHFFVDCLKYKLASQANNFFTIDQGEYVENPSRCVNGFHWSDRRVSNKKWGRDLLKGIKKRLSKKINKINILGSQELVGFGIKESSFNNKCHFANGVLVHNSEHVPMLFLDEIDVVQDPRALKEAKMIPSVFGDYFPLTVYLSTRKFAGGLMEKTLKETPAAGGEILRWNILDVCERVTHEEARVDQPKIVRYVSRELPMVNLAPEDWKELKEENQIKYERIEAYAGIAEHPMLPIMHNYLVDRPQSDVGNLYKPLVAVHNNFKQTPPDMGEAQLLCNKPSASGLVYPRFENTNNVLTVSDAIKRIAGDDCDIDNFEYLKDYLKNLGIPIIGGADWGFSDMTCLVVIAMLPTGEAWLLDSIAIGKLELDDIVKYTSGLQREWDVDKWYVDQAYPAYIKTLKRNGIKCPKFKKVVEDGIAALQAKIVDSNNIRKFFVVDTPNNKIVIDAFGDYRWALDGKGDVIEGKPHHGNDGTSDIMDAIRYPAQNMFIRGAGLQLKITGENANKPKVVKAPTREENAKLVKKVNNDIMASKISELAAGDKNRVKIKKKGRIFWG